MQITYIIIQNLFLRSSRSARMSQGISGCFFRPRSRNKKISLQSKNDIKQAYRNYCFAQECFASKFKRSTDVHAWLWSDEHTKQTNELGINYKVSKCHFAPPLSIHGLHGNPNSLYQYLLFCSEIVSFHSGEHQNQKICHLMKTNKNFGGAGWVFHIFLKELLFFLVFNI